MDKMRLIEAICKMKHKRTGESVEKLARIYIHFDLDALVKLCIIELRR